jgi:sugar/nucleoside kinase (ribokinase family)
MSLVVVGSVAYDGVITPHGSVDRMLGGACTYISLAASYFTPVKIVGVVGTDFADEDHQLLISRNIDTDGLERAEGLTFFWRGEYYENMNQRKTLQTDLNVFEHFNPKLPEHYKDQPYLLLGNIQPALQKGVRAQMKAPKLTGGDTMNLWIDIARDELLATIAEWDVLVINDEEAYMLSGEKSIRKSAEKIIEMGPKTLIIKRGGDGAMLFRKDHYFVAPAYPLSSLCDPTGAGDCFAGGFFGYLAGVGLDPAKDFDTTELNRAVIYGSVMGSFCCERFGVERFRSLSRDEIDARYEEFRKITSF